jgi:hypothetical protein
MKRGIISSLAVLALWGSVGLNFASAQFGGLGQAPPRVRPAISPYINMGTGGAEAYYGIVRPQMNTNQSLTDLQQGVNRLNPDGSLKGQLNAQNTPGALGGLQTGHAASFFNYGRYFPLVPPGGMTNATAAGFGPGLGGFDTGLTGTGFGVGAGATTAGRTFFSPNLNQPLIRP